MGCRVAHALPNPVASIRVIRGRRLCFFGRAVLSRRSLVEGGCGVAKPQTSNLQTFKRPLKPLNFFGGTSV